MNSNPSTENLPAKDSKIRFAPFRILSNATEETLIKANLWHIKKKFQLATPTLVPAQFLYIPSSICEPRLYLHIPSSIREPRFLQPHIPSSICEPRMFFIGPTLQKEQSRTQRIYRNQLPNGRSSSLPSTESNIDESIQKPDQS